MFCGPLLIVDDEPANLAVLRGILKDDYSLMLARSGLEALVLADKHRPSLILLDIQMPGMDGYTVCRALKANPATEAIPVIFVTTLSELGNEEAGFDAGCVDYLIKPVYAGIVRARVRTHLSLVKSTLVEKTCSAALDMLGKAGHYNDSDTGAHIWRMAAYARQLAEAVGWSKARCDLLEQAAPMHDTGKIGIPDAVLRKPGKLDAGEWAIMRTHSRIGYEILTSSDAPVFQLAAEIALRHHEQWDGSGYPDGLSGTAIPESARIVAVADVFDALTMKRPYKDAWPVEQALEALREGAGRHFDPPLVGAFEACLPRILEIKAGWDRREAEEGQ
ncbi:putative two-component system response regulator [Methylomagnum ishizawai]|uniref:Putative two-component system response regulator n=1 Tax=Methylomagnum ishizawai TaxID=1760988 RepID=A0A1Y6D311_9GAMM|nr:HD domain-containing phosphohydrolase [Methylomagnum ishizawai]SMF97338.1 putative two-component system response regulator [Methylomagnum ishizawai]